MIWPDRLLAFLERNMLWSKADGASGDDNGKENLSCEFVSSMDEEHTNIQKIECDYFFI